MFYVAVDLCVLCGCGKLLRVLDTLFVLGMLSDLTRLQLVLEQDARIEKESIGYYHFLILSKINVLKCFQDSSVAILLN